MTSLLRSSLASLLTIPFVPELLFAFPLLVAAVCFPTLVREANADNRNLPKCDGFNPNTGTWGMLQVEPKHPQAECAEGMALVFHVPLTGGVYPPESRAIVGSCCPLPAGALLNRHSYHPAACPKGSVITGGRFLKYEESAPGKGIASYEVRCTEIDGSRFELENVGEPLSFEFGTDDIFTYFRSDSKIESRTGRNHLPLSLAEGIGRTSKTTWTASGCIGYPWGGALTKIGSSGCNDFEFMNVLERPPAAQANSDSSTNR